MMINRLIKQLESQKAVDPRLISFLILYSIFKQNKKSDDAINFYLQKYNTDSQNINFIFELVKGTVKRKLTLDYYIKCFSKKDSKKPPFEIILILRMGIYQLFYMDSVPEYAAVNESVNLCALINSKMKGFVNAVLRSVIRNKNKIEISIDNPIRQMSIKYSFPEWMIKRWMSEYGKKNCESMCEIFNRPFEICLRTNRLKSSRDNLIALLKERNVVCKKGYYSQDAIYCSNIRRLETLDLFQDGYFFVQGEASMLIGEISNPEKGLRILDMCSAPGGKSTHLAEIMGNNGEIVAADINDGKLRLVEENARRLVISCIKTHPWDNLEKDCRELGVFDYVLIDAPCSNLGILRKLPESRWTKKPKDLKSLRNVQLNLLEKGLRFLQEDGTLLYSVCTLTREENENIVEEFLSNHKELKIVDLKKDEGLRVRIDLPDTTKYESLFTEEGFLKLLPFKHKVEGFFAAKIQFK